MKKKLKITYNDLGKEKETVSNKQEFWANTDFLETQKYKCRNWLVLGGNLLLPWLD